MQSSRLRGADHEQIGEIASLAAGPAAVALSRGGAAKTYPHRHDNEDAAGFVHGGAGSLAVVADGHGGREAAELAVGHVLERLAPRWLDAAARDFGYGYDAEARRAAWEIHRAILRAAIGDEVRPSRTTLSVALTRPREGWFGHWSVGDSHVFEVGREAIREPCAPGANRVVYLGDAAAAESSVSGSVRVGGGVIGSARCLVLATDGLSEAGIGLRDPAAAVARIVGSAEDAAPGLRALSIARTLVARALASHREQRSGDNVAAAVLWLAAPHGFV